MPIEPNETERTGELRMLFVQVIEGAKRFRRIGDFGEYASLSVIYQEEALHSFRLTLMPGFVTRPREAATPRAGQTYGHLKLPEDAGRGGCGGVSCE